MTTTELVYCFCFSVNVSERDGNILIHSKRRRQINTKPNVMNRIHVSVNLFASPT